MKKIGILSDIHGNLTALEAVVTDAKAQGVTEYWLLGDILLPGQGERDIIDLLRDLPITMKVVGNWDQDVLYVLSHVADKDWEEERFDPRDVYFFRLVQYLMEKMEPADFDFIQQLPLVDQKTVSGLTFGICHNLPDKTYGQDLLVQAPQENFDKLLQDDWDVAIYGHVHSQMMRYTSDRRLIINPGTIGQPFFFWGPFNRNLHAQYAILEINELGLENVLFRKVAYDAEKEKERAREKQLPYLALYEEILDTGVTHHHDRPLLASIHEKTDYAQDVQNFFGIDKEKFS